MAAKVAIIATIAMGMMHQLIVGTVRNSRNPVNLLTIVLQREFEDLLAVLIFSLVRWV